MVAKWPKNIRNCLPARTLVSYKKMNVPKNILIISNKMKRFVKFAMKYSAKDHVVPKVQKWPRFGKLLENLLKCDSYSNTKSCSYRSKILCLLFNTCSLSSGANVRANLKRRNSVRWNKSRNKHPLLIKSANFASICFHAEAFLVFYEPCNWSYIPCFVHNLSHFNSSSASRRGFPCIRYLPEK